MLELYLSEVHLSEQNEQSQIAFVTAGIIRSC
jgi:hypothetical protein